ncbi:carboxyl transferase domain-containing protein [Caenibius sp. WL]|uniref:acyl-CoA carboxylase subunit beta n=1 Tax=Caenibius sp. WL TaxID=2872646 RepID=UPI001C991160|nr:carboxyl transferase domain-containing protein [Caenibius sp. WL]
MSGSAAKWGAILDELERRRAFGRTMGGEERLARQAASGKLNARQRLETLFDGGAFVEIGGFTGVLSEGGDAPAPCDAFVAGFGKVDGRPVLAGAEDFTVLGGSIGMPAADKRYRLTEIAAQERLPLVFMLEGAGHRPTNSHDGRTPNDLQGLAALSGMVPLVSLVMGASAGHGALTAPLCDFVAMTRQASIFAAGPPLVKAAVGEVVTKEELGGPDVHVMQSGLVHNLVEDDAAAIALARTYLSYFPSNAWEAPPVRESGDCGPRRIEELLDLVSPDPRMPFSMRQLARLVVDEGSFLEIQPHFGASLVTGLARIGGRNVAILANDPSVRAGAIDAAAADKAAHFLDVIGAFRIPAIFLTDNPGVMAGTVAEKSGILRHAARMFMAQHRLRSPKIHVTLRKAFGFGSSIMAMNPFDRQTAVYAFPSITLGAMPVGGAADAAKLDDATRARLEAEQAGSAYHLADGMKYDDVIDPRDLRNALLHGLALTQARGAQGDGPVHQAGILP